jgi:hypothetical protein
MINGNKPVIKALARFNPSSRVFIGQAILEGSL